jgi:uncharacterized protein YcbX
MSPRISTLYRHPIKGLGVEALESVTLRPGHTMPGDREWALAQQGAKIDKGAPEWTRCMAFIRGAKAPTLMAVTTEREADGQMRLSHPARPDLVFDPMTEAGEAALIEWLLPLYPDNRPAPDYLVHLPDRGMTDSSTQTVTLMSDASLKDLSNSIGHPLDRRRFRGNLWVDGLSAWQELELIGQEITFGPLTGRILKPVERCRAPSGNPETGVEDIDVLGHLNTAFGHPNFGVFVEITRGGTVTVGDKMTIGVPA